MLKLTPNQAQLADSLDEMEVGQTILFASEDQVFRESPTRYVLNDERDRLCFVQVYDRLKNLSPFTEREGSFPYEPACDCDPDDPCSDCKPEGAQ